MFTKMNISVNAILYERTIISIASKNKIGLFRLFQKGNLGTDTRGHRRKKGKEPFVIKIWKFAI